MKLTKEFIPTTIFEPLYIEYRGMTFSAHEKIEVKIIPCTEKVGRSIHGYDKIEFVGLRVQVSLVPLIEFNQQSLNILYPYLNTKTGSLISTTEKDILRIYTRQNTVYEIYDAHVMRMPDLYLNDSPHIFGKIVFNGTWIPIPKKAEINFKDISSAFNIERKKIFHETLHGQLLCKWGNKKPWNKFYPHGGIHIQFKTHFIPDLSKIKFQQLKLIFERLDLHINLKSLHFNKKLNLTEKIDDFNLAYTMPAGILSLWAYKLGHAQWPTISLSNNPSPHNNLLIKNTLHRIDTNHSIFKLSFKQKNIPSS